MVTQDGARRKHGFERLEKLEIEKGGEEKEHEILRGRKEKMMSIMLILSIFLDLYKTNF